jgi:hypothetical protein
MKRALEKHQAELVLLARRLRHALMRTTRQERRSAIDLPPDAMAVLKWHVETQLKTPEQQDSDLLFPAVNGRFRSPSVLNKPLADVVEELNLGKKITQRALRRTFNDLACAALSSNLLRDIIRRFSKETSELWQRPDDAARSPQLLAVEPIERRLPTDSSLCQLRQAVSCSVLRDPGAFRKRGDFSPSILLHVHQHREHLLLGTPSRQSWRHGARPVIFAQHKSIVRSTLRAIHEGHIYANDKPAPPGTHEAKAARR